MATSSTILYHIAFIVSLAIELQYNTPISIRIYVALTKPELYFYNIDRLGDSDSDSDCCNRRDRDFELQIINK
jgi:hypothetical protein